MTLIRKKGFPFAFDSNACEQCRGACCSGASGHVWVTPRECERMARLMDMNLLDFLDRCTYKKDGRISLKERRSGQTYDCIFFNAKTFGCTVYTARPSQCRTYPFWPWNRDRMEALKAECPGVVELEP